MKKRIVKNKENCRIIVKAHNSNNKLTQIGINPKPERKNYIKI